MTANIKVLEEQLSEKDRQLERLSVQQSKELEAKNKQIEDLTSVINTQAQSINAVHHAELASKLGEQKLIESATDEEKPKAKLGERLWFLFRGVSNEKATD